MSTTVAAANPPLPLPPVQDNPAKKELTTCQKVGRVFLWILFSIVAVALMVFTAPIFFVGVVVGIIWKDKMLGMVEKIKQIWLNSPWATLGFTVLATALAFPIPLLTGSLLVGGYIGVRFSNYTQQKPEEKLPAN